MVFIQVIFNLKLQSCQNETYFDSFGVESIPKETKKYHNKY